MWELWIMKEEGKSGNAETKVGMDLVMLPETPRWHQRPCFSTLKTYETFLVTLIFSLSCFLIQFSLVCTFIYLLFFFNSYLRTLSL